MSITGTVTDKEDGLKLLRVKVKINNLDKKSVLTADYESDSAKIEKSK